MVTDPLSNITQLFYDEIGNKVKEVDAEGKEKTFEYDDNDNEIAVEYENTSGSGCSSCSGGNTDQPSRVVYPSDGGRAIIALF